VLTRRQYGQRLDPPAYRPCMRGWPLLRNRDYMLFWSGEALSELGSQTSTVAYPLLVLTLTGSAAKAGVVGLAKWLPLAIFAIPAGALADRVDRKRLMIASDAIRMLGAASIVAALWLGRPPFAQVAMVAFLDGGLFITSHICERGAHHRAATGRTVVLGRARTAVPHRHTLVPVLDDHHRPHAAAISSRHRASEKCPCRADGGLRVAAPPAVLPHHVAAVRGR
jgi:hypothetical protein